MAIWISIETFETNTRIIKQSKIFCITDLYVLQIGYLHIWWWTTLLVQLCSKDFCVIKLTICILIVFCFKYLNIFDCVVWTLQRKKCKIIWSLFCIILEEVQIKFVSIKDWFQSLWDYPFNWRCASASSLLLYLWFHVSDVYLICYTYYYYVILVIMLYILLFYCS